MNIKKDFFLYYLLCIATLYVVIGILIAFRVQEPLAKTLLSMGQFFIVVSFSVVAQAMGLSMITNSFTGFLMLIFGIAGITALIRFHVNRNWIYTLYGLSVLAMLTTLWNFLVGPIFYINIIHFLDSLLLVFGVYTITASRAPAI